MNIYTLFERVIAKSLADLQQDGRLPTTLDTAKVVVEPCKDPAHGDMATNAALVLSKQAGMPPRALAALLEAQLAVHPDILHTSVAGVGFLNLTLTPMFWQSHVLTILEAGVEYGASTLGKGEHVNIEYVSANPTGPLHLGHTRGAVFGDVLANLLTKVGYAVTKEYYINDAGAQVETLARSAFLRYREALGEDIGDIPQGYYPGEYLKPVGESIAAEEGNIWRDKPESAWLPVFKEKAINAMMALIREDLAALGIHHDVFVSQQAVLDTGGVERAIKVLEERGYYYIGTLEPPKGKKGDDWQPREQPLFRSTAFGDDEDRALQKADGSWTYFASDMPYLLNKFERGFHHQVIMLGADHTGYVRRMAAAVAALSGGAVSLDIKLCQLVNLFKDGQPYKMSKRAGTFVTARDIIDDLGKDVLRFMMLTRKNDIVFDFDIAKATEQSKDNPVFYVQYAHARAHSVLRHAATHFSPEIMSDRNALNLAVLTDEAELNLIKWLAGFPRVVETAALAHEPHRLTFYLYDIAHAFHALWNKGREHAELRFIDTENSATTLARLALIQATVAVIGSGLGIMGVVPVDEM